MSEYQKISDENVAQILEQLEKRGDTINKENKADLFNRPEEDEEDFDIQETLDKFFKKFNDNDSLESYKYGHTIGSSSNSKNAKDLILETINCIEHVIKKNVREKDAKMVSQDLGAIFAINRYSIELLDKYVNSKELKLEHETLLAAYIGFFTSKYYKLKQTKE